MRPASLGLGVLAPLCACGGSAGMTPIEARPEGPMDLVTAQRYLLGLVNRDRAEHDLGPVVWDEAAARAGQRHAEDMAAKGFTAHIGSDGSVPELRYTEAGGGGMVMENVGCVADAEPRRPARDPRFSADSIERVQKAFMDEVPPHDGHKKNILMPWHTSLGVGLAQPEGFDIACMAQEFVDHWGEYDELPDSAKVGKTVSVEGKVTAPAKFGGVGVARVDMPGPRTPKELLQTGGYKIPKPHVMYFPAGYKTPIPVQVDGESFRIAVPLDDDGKPGLYQISIWATVPNRKELTMVSLRTLPVTR
jgi:uncharacterized protein YkwD